MTSILAISVSVGMVMMGVYEASGQSLYTEVVSSNENFIGVYTSTNTSLNYITWFDARQYCIDNYITDLAQINSENENNEALNVSNLASELGGAINNNNQIWIGLNDIKTESEYLWINNNGEPTYTNWNSGEPNNWFTGITNGIGEDCVQIYGGNGKWNDLRCDPPAATNNAFLCGKKNGKNDLCNYDKWNIIKGYWTYNSKDCIITNDNIGDGNIIWIGDTTGEIPSCDYDNENYILNVYMSVSSGTGGAGILFNAKNVSSINASGQQYFFGFRVSENRILLTKIDGSWNQLKDTQSINLDYSKKYKMTIDVNGNNYNFYFDNQLVFENVTLNDFDHGSVGFRTFRTTATFYSIMQALV